MHFGEVDVLHRYPMPGAKGRNHASGVPKHHELWLHTHGGIRDVRSRGTDWNEKVRRFYALGQQ
jgi:hypothetical protein